MGCTARSVDVKLKEKIRTVEIRELLLTLGYSGLDALFATQLTCIEALKAGLVCW